ncbi:hypothetical protein [Aeoliella sp.]|uniref:hypothetical protein n=1 Tax=Aeoliella sp. TaxID=2795800 RepID=UPI003CCBD3F1
MKFAIACATLATIGLVATDANAQCSTCAVPQVTYSPVVYNTYNDGWYLGKYFGRMGRRVFGTAPASAYAVGYAPTYSYASYAPTYSASYGSTCCNTCGTSPCCCAQTTYRPVIMQPACGCTTCGGCSTCGTCSTCNSCSSCGVVQSSYDAPASSSCPTCNTSSYYEDSSSSSDPAPSLNNSAPPQTYRETDRLDPTPATESGNESQALDLSPPLLLDPNSNDKVTKRPTAPVWTAVYKQPAKITNVSSAKPKKKTIGWSAGH